MHILYVANARIPTEKAHGIQIAKMCEAFIEAGAQVTLVVPARRTVAGTMRAFYGLSVDIPLVRLPVLDTYQLGSFGFIIGSLSFMLTSFFFVLVRKMRGEHFVVYTVDMDTFSSSLLPLAGVPVFTEMHTTKPLHGLQRHFFRCVQGVIAVNRLLAEELQTKFKNSHAQYLIEPNGVDGELFHARDKAEARTRLGLPEDARIALYVGRFFDWKGLEILPAAAEATPGIEWYLVGGTKEGFERVTGMPVTSSMHFAGDVSQAEIPWWIAASDAVVVLGTKRDRQSYYYTSPMKLFEYLVSERPIVASATPAIREVVSEREVLFYEPDVAEDLGANVRDAIDSSAAHASRIVAAHALGERYSWKGRAERILTFMRGSV